MTPSPDDGQRPADTIESAAVVAGIGFGVVLRAVLLAAPTGAFDSDEAIVGLMARHVVERADFSTFFYGQSYGGSLEALLTIPAVAALGTRPAAVKLVPVVLSAVAAILLWRLGRRTVGPRAATVAAVTFWIWPANYVWFSTKARGFYWVALVLGLVFVLSAIRLAERPTRWADWTGLGLSAGLGWWTTPQIAYFVVPATLWLGWRLRQDAWRAAAAVPALLAGASPWLLYNLRTDWRSLEVTTREFDKGFAGNIGVLFTNGIPVALGLHAAERWLVPVVFPVIYVAVLGWLAWTAMRAGRAARLVVAVALAYPLIWGVLPVSGVVGEGRYVLFLAPFLALLLAHAAAHAVARAGLLAVAAALSVAGAVAIRDHSRAFLVDRAGGAPVVIEMPDDTGALRRALARQHITRAYADYWIAYRTTFETGERVIVAPLNTSRYPRYDKAVASAPAPAYLFVAGAPSVEVLLDRLDQADIAYERTRAGGFVVIEPEGRVSFP